MTNFDNSNLLYYSRSGYGIHELKSNIMFLLDTKKLNVPGLGGFDTQWVKLKIILNSVITSLKCLVWLYRISCIIKNVVNIYGYYFVTIPIFLSK